MQENNNTNSVRTNPEAKVYEKGSFGWLKEQQKIKVQKDGFDNVDDWSKWRMEGAIKNIDLVKKILEENKVEITDRQTFYRFWSKVDIKDNKEECWNWAAAYFIGGYGHFSSNSTIETLSHRIVYLLTKGFIPEGLCVLHLCNNRKCCNPNHLELGDHFKNMQYMFKCERCNRTGENNGSSKLTEDQVRDIHKIYNEQRRLHPGLKQWQIVVQLAQKFVMSQETIKAIIAGRLWHYIYKEFYEKD